MLRLLRVESTYFVAGAIWDGKKCIRAAPILKWMVGKNPNYVKDYLQRKGWRYEWF